MQAALPAGVDAVEATPEHLLVEFPHDRLGVFYVDLSGELPRWRFDLMTQEQWDTAEGELLSILVSTTEFATSLVREIWAWPTF